MNVADKEPTPTIWIESAHPSDREEIISLILTIQREEFGVAITREDQPDLEEIKKFYQKGHGGFWVARHEREILGTVALLDIGDKSVALRKMFVKKEHRGSGKGVAARLLRIAIEFCQIQGVQDIYLGTIDHYYAAHRFYEKNGFSRIPKESLPKSFPLMAVDNVFYHLHLEAVGE